MRTNFSKLEQTFYSVDHSKGFALQILVWAKVPSKSFALQELVRAPLLILVKRSPWNRKVSFNPARSCRPALCSPSQHLLAWFFQNRNCQRPGFLASVSIRVFHRRVDPPIIHIQPNKYSLYTGASFLPGCRDMLFDLARRLSRACTVSYTGDFASRGLFRQAATLIDGYRDVTFRTRASFKLATTIIY